MRTTLGSTICHGSQGGLTLVEILVALMILAVGLVSVFALFGLAAATHSRGVDARTVADLAATVLAEIEKRFAEKEPKDLGEQKHPLFPQEYVYSVEFVPLGGAGGRVYLVKLTITWQTRGKRHTEIFEKVMLLGKAEKKDN